MMSLKKTLFGLMMMCVGLIGISSQAADVNLSIFSSVNQFDPYDTINPGYGGSGSIVSVNIEVANGLNTASGFVVSIVYPAEVSFIADGVWTNNIATRTITRVVPSLLGSSLIDGYYVMMIPPRFTINGSYSYRDISFVTSISPSLFDRESNPVNNTYTASRQIGYKAFFEKTFSIVPSTSPLPYEYKNAGDTVNYDINYTNEGTFPVTINFSDIKPSGMLFSLAFIAGCQNSLFSPLYENTNSFYYNNCVVAPGDTISVSLVATILQPTYISLTNNASVDVFTLGGVSTVSRHNSSIAIYPYPVLSVSKVLTGSLPQTIGQNVRFAITIENTGSANAANVSLKDILPQGFRFVSISPSASAVSANTTTNEYTWNVSIPAKSKQTYIVTAQLDASNISIGTQLSNTAMIDFNGTGIVTLSSATAPFAIAGIPDVTLTKTIISPDFSGYVYQSGDQVGYRITLYNSGNAIASGVLTDYFPSQITPLSSSLSPTSTAGSIWSRNNISIAPSQTLTIFLTGILNNNYSANTTYTNNADFVLTNLSGTVRDNGTVEGTVMGRPDLVVTKTMISSAPQLSGDQVVYRLTLANSGTNVFSGTRCLTDTRPSQVVFGSSSLTPSGCNGAYSRSGTASQLPFTVILTGNLSANAAVFGTTIINTGSVSTTTSQLSTINDVATATTVVGGVGVLNLSKTTTSTTINGISGTIIRYTIVYANTGSQSISGFVLSDTLPAGLVYVSGSVVPTVNGSTLTWPSTTLMPGSGATIIIDTRLTQAYTSGSIVNCLSASATSRYLSGTVTERCATTIFSPVSDLSIKKTILSGAQGLSGSDIVFRLDIANVGSTGATDVSIIDVVSTGISILPSVQSSFGGTATWNQEDLGRYTLALGSIAAGQTGTIIYTGRLNFQPTATYNYTNTATLTGSFADAVISNNTSTVSASVTASVGCVISKVGQGVWSVSQGGVDLSGQVVSYTINLTNNGTIPLTNISLTDTRPSGLTRPTNLDTNNIFAAGISLNPGQTTGFVLTGKLLDRSNVSLLNSVTANYTMNGVSFSCVGSGDVVKKAPSCNNGYLEEGEQCDVYVNNGITSVITLSGSLFNTNSFSFDGGTTTQTCDACKLKATAAKNCVTMTVSGLSPKVSCADLQGPTDTVKLTLKKYVDGNDAQDSASAVTKQAGNEAEYKIVITNTSSTTATDVVLSDTLPAGVEYIAGTLSPTTVTYTNGTINGNLGTLAGGQSITVTLRVKITANNSSITNIATVNYKDSGGVPQSPVSDPAVIKGGSSVMTCHDGVLDNGQNGTTNNGEQCDLGYNNATIGLYLNSSGVLNTSIYSDRGKACRDCKIVDPELNRCGDGILGKLEQCDLGVNGGTIGTHLDTRGTVMASSQYQGKKCDIGCNIVGNPTIPACWYTDTVISVMKDEVLPIAWDVEISSGVVETSSQCNASNNGMIVKDSLECTFRIYNKNEESDTRDGGASSFDRTLPCNTQQWKNSNGELYKAFQNDPLFVEHPYGSFLVGVDVDVNGNKLDLKNGYGEYKVSLDKVSYSYCDGNGKSTKSPNVYARVCQINIAVTRPYLMQKSNTIYKPNDPLKDFFVLGYPAKTIISDTQFDSLSERTQLSSLEYKGSIKTLTENLVKKYESTVKITNPDLGPLGNVKKVPGKAIYIIDGGGDLVLEGNALGTAPSTLIVKGSGKLTIRGSVGANMLILVPNGSVTFDIDTSGNDQYSSEDHRCGPQVIRGIVVAKEFVAANKTIRNTEAEIRNHPRCRKGNLQVYGALYGDHLEDLVQSRRSHLEHWFTYRTNFNTNTAPTEAEKNKERRDEIYKGASVYIEQNPDLWRSMPPGAEDFLKTLNVSRN